MIDRADLTAIILAISGNYVSTGCQVTAQSTPNMTVQVSAGTIYVNGTSYAIAAVASLAVTAPSSHDRRDIVVANSSAVVSIIEGTPCTVAGWTPISGVLPPVKPAIPALSVILGEIYVASTTTSITSANITDKTTLYV